MLRRMPVRNSSYHFSQRSKGSGLRTLDWPALMRPVTARSYLDGIVGAAKFESLVAPYLDARMIGGRLAYTRRSIDDWIERGNRSENPQTPEELAKLLDDDDNQSSQG
jgi:hypothetical protein